MIIISVLVPLIIGFILGLIGGGGSILTVPALVYIFGLNAKTAIATSLLVVGLSAVVAMFNHSHLSKIPFKSVIPLGISGMIGSYLAGSYLAPKLSDSFQLILFAGMIITTAFYMWHKKNVLDSNHHKKPKYFLSISVGFLLGVLTGIIGVGGGFLIVPALIAFLEMHLYTAIASSLLIIMMQALTGFLAYINFVNLDLNFTLSFLTIFILGSFLGAKFSSKIPTEILNKIFAVILFGIGVLVFIKELA